MFAAIEKFFAMGGYGFYVWTAYLLFFAILGLNILIPYRKQQRTKKQLALMCQQTNESSS